MIALVQRVDRAKVEADGAVCGAIERGLLVLLGVKADDGEEDIAYVTDKVCGLRIFPDEQGKQNLSVKDVGGKLLIVSQFTLCGDVRKGKRPSFDSAARPEIAKGFYLDFIRRCREKGCEAATGIFGAHMLVELTNNGPVTIIIDSAVKTKGGKS